MRKVLLILLLFATIASKSQNIDCQKIVPFKDGRVFYEGVVIVDNASSATLYSNAKLWLGKTFVISKDVVQSEVVNSVIVAKGIIDKIYTFTLTIQFKDGRYKYEISDFGVDTFVPGLNKPMKGSIESFPLFKNCKEAPLILFDSKVKKIIASLESGIKANNDDW
ncbi:DUF4468 domain-containing protein [Dysgonomonas termitidis]|uniref:DUF4468 domain-containing protein n=1 Tax=Dysgonomonas termitidis TaxID=1516126 RepID=A0ABV9KQY6_9BACT